MINLRLVFLMCLEFCAGGCAHLPGPAPVPHPGATCESVCAHEAQLGCDAAKPTAHGASCVEICTNVELSGLARFDLPCMDAAPTCAAVDDCSAAPQN